MSNFEFGNIGDHISDNAQIITDIRQKIHGYTDSDGAIEVVFNTETDDIVSSSGFEFAESIQEIYPELDHSEAGEIESVFRSGEEGSARVRVQGLQAFFAMSAVYKEIARLKSANPDISDEGIRDELNLFVPTQPEIGLSRSAYFEDIDDSTSYVFTYTALHNSKDEPPVASKYSVDISEYWVTKSYSFIFLATKPVLSVVKTHIEKDTLRDRAGLILSPEDYGQVLLTMGGMLPGEAEDVDSYMGNIWLKYQGTSKETEVGPLLDEVIDRYEATCDAEDISRQVNSYTPTLQELVDLNTQLS